MVGSCRFGWLFLRALLIAAALVFNQPALAAGAFRTRLIFDGRITAVANARAHRTGNAAHFGLNDGVPCSCSKRRSCGMGWGVRTVLRYDDEPRVRCLRRCRRGPRSLAGGATRPPDSAPGEARRLRVRCPARRGSVRCRVRPGANQVLRQVKSEASYRTE